MFYIRPFYCCGNSNFAINRRYTAAITSIGGHYAESSALASYLNLPLPLSALTASAETAALISKKTVASEAIQQYKSSDRAVSVDGTWQKQGFSFRKGMVTTLSVLGKTVAVKFSILKPSLLIVTNVRRSTKMRIPSSLLWLLNMIVQ